MGHDLFIEQLVTFTAATLPERRTHHRKSEPSEGERDWKGERESRERNGRWGRSEVRAREEVRSLREKSR